ncbi:MAG: IPT/TIG domain-containing protein [Elusimicrobiota bacterium]
MFTFILRTKFFALLCVSLFSFGTLLADQPVCSASYITNETRGEETVDRDGTNLQGVNIFAFQFNGSCQIEPQSIWVEEVSRKFRHDPKRLILIDMVNEINRTPGPCRNFSSGQALHYVLSDPDRRAAHIRDLVAISALGQGLEIDYEHVLSSTTVLLTQFMGELRAALPTEKKLGMVVQPKTQGGREQGITVDWRGVEPYVDYLRVMAYYYSWNTSPPGPVITYSKLAQVADYMLNSPTQSIPREKARILISLYGWDWPISPASPGKLIQFHQAMAIANAKGITPQRDPVQDTLYFQYTDDQNVLHEVWFEDVVGHKKRIQQLMDINFPAIDLWNLNTGDPALWEWFKPLIKTDCAALVGPPTPPAAAIITSLTPSAVKSPGSDITLTINGSGFTASDIVLFAGNPIAPTFVSPTQLQVFVSSRNVDRPGARRVAVTQNGYMSNTLDFYVVGNPVINLFEPNTVEAGTESFVLTIRGEGFEPASFVRFNGRDILTIQFIHGGEIKVNIPNDLIANPGTFRVGVTNPTSGAQISRFFTVTPKPAPPPGPNPTPDPVPSPVPDPVLPEGFQVGPNPWNAAKNTGGIRFYNIEPQSELKILTVAGQLVKKIETSSAITEWDLKNGDGEDVSSGLYLYIVEKGGGLKERGRFVVIR